MNIKPDNNHTCFCCGSKNENGLKLNFKYPEPGFAEAECIIPEYFSGWRDMTHGGFLAMLLDEVMAHACLSLEKPAVTASMKVRYLKPVNVGTKLILKGEIKEIRLKIISVKGEIFNEDNEKIAGSKGRFMSVE